MKKKFICTVCGYIYEGTEAPEFCPLCKAPRSKFKEVSLDDEPEFATVHELGRAYTDKVSDELVQHCKNTFAGECSEVGMYLAMAIQKLHVHLSTMPTKKLTTPLATQSCWAKC